MDQENPRNIAVAKVLVGPGGCLPLWRKKADRRAVETALAGGITVMTMRQVRAMIAKTAPHGATGLLQRRAAGLQIARTQVRGALGGLFHRR
ncbi:MAG: hypothetical protein ACPGGK_05990 [Pikeienuella sp.]